jgi:alpha-1,2-mannosyltransferase
MQSALERAPGVDAPGTRTWRDLWTPARARLWLVACAVAAFLPAVGVPIRGWLDFSAFYAAGALAFSSDVARLAPIVAWQQLHGLPITPFVYPPGMALLYVPFAALPYGLAAALHLALMGGLLVTAAILGADALLLPRRWSVIAALAWGPAAAGVISGQNTALALLMVVVAALALQRGRQALSGGLVGLLAYKPQLAAPLVLLFVVRSRWVALASAALLVSVHYLAGVVATGGNAVWPTDWLATLNAYTGADYAANGWQAISLPALGQHLTHATGIPGLMLLGYLAAAGIVVVCIPSMRRLPVLEAVALACACGLVISPHAWVYDATLLLPALAVFARRAAAGGWPSRSRWWLAIAFALGLTWPLGGLIGVTALPLVVVAAPFALLERGPFRSPR